MYKNIIFDFGGVVVNFNPRDFLMDHFMNRRAEEETYDIVFGSQEWQDLDRGTITREAVSVSHLKRLFAEHGAIVSAKPEQRRLLEIVNERYDLELEIPETLKLFQLSEQHRRLVVINVQGLRRKNGSLLPEYTEEEFNEATFIFVKYYIQGRHYDELVEENKKLQFELDQEVEWRNRTDNG